MVPQGYHLSVVFGRFQIISPVISLVLLTVPDLAEGFKAGTLPAMFPNPLARLPSLDLTGSSQWDIANLGSRISTYMDSGSRI
jgi:hypothetical protein